MGFDDFEVYTPINGLGHPFGQMIAFSSFVFHGVFDEFPTLRVAFLEAGSGWVSLWIDRMDRSWQYHADILPDGKLRTLKERKPSDYFRTGGSSSAAKAARRACPRRSSASATSYSCSPRISRTR